jgi:hypothetical protein
MLSLGTGKVIVSEQTREKLQEWLESVPEIVRQRESANILAFVFFVEVLKEKEGNKKGVQTRNRQR